MDPGNLDDNIDEETSIEDKIKTLNQELLEIQRQILETPRNDRERLQAKAEQIENKIVHALQYKKNIRRKKN